MATNNSVNNILYGTTAGGNAGAGYVGELISSQVLDASAISISNTSAKTLTSISLTAGDWDVWGNLFFIPTGLMTQIISAISTTNNAVNDTSTISQISVNFTSAGDQGIVAPDRRINVSSPTTVYIVGIAEFSSGSCTFCGGIYARRTR